MIEREPPAGSAYLRPLRRADAADVLAAFRSNADMARQGEVSGLAEARDYLDRLLAVDSSHLPWAIAIDDRLVGLVAITEDRQNRSGWFWYWMTEGARGRGLTSRAAATLATWALTTGGMERLELGHRSNNPASGAVAAAAGFVREGTEREKFLIEGRRIDVHTYGRLRSDPPPTLAPLPMQEPAGSATAPCGTSLDTGSDAGKLNGDTSPKSKL